MSIEVLTRRIERLKHHLHLLDDGATTTGVHDGPQHSHHHYKPTGNLDLAPLMNGKHRRTPTDTTLSRGNAAQRLPNASFGAGATLVSRQRQALAAAVQQAAARGVTQIRDELQCEETTLYGRLLQKYISLCEGLMETPDAQFQLNIGEEDRTTSRASSNASSPQRNATGALDATGECIPIGDSNDPPNTSPMAVVDGASPPPYHQEPPSVLQRSHSVVGLDATQRGRNARVEQLAVACQILLGRRRRFDMLDAKLKDVDTWVQRFNDTLRDCNRLLRISTAAVAGYPTAASSGSPSGSKHASPHQVARQQQVPQGMPAATIGTKLAPINVHHAGSRSQGGKSSTTAPLSPVATGDARSPRGGPLGKVGGDDKQHQGSSSSTKVLHAKVNDALAEVRGAVIRLLLHLQDLMAEHHAHASASSSTEVSFEQSGGSRLLSSAPTATGGLSETSRVAHTHGGNSLLLERKQTVLHERMVRVCHHIKMAFADASEFCPPSLGAVCTTPLFVDVSVLMQHSDSGSTTGRDVQQRRSSTNVELRPSSRSLGDMNPTVPIALQRRGSASIGSGGGATPDVLAPLSGGRRSSSLFAGTTGSRGSSLTGGSKQMLVPRSVRDSETLMVLRAYDVWTKLANTLSVDVPPTAVPFIERYVASSTMGDGVHPTGASVYLRPALIDARHPELLHELTSAAGRMYSEADLFGAVLSGGAQQPGTLQRDVPPARNAAVEATSTRGAALRSAAAAARLAEDRVIEEAAAAAITAVASTQPSSPVRPPSELPSHHDATVTTEDNTTVRQHPLLCDVSDIVAVQRTTEDEGVVEEVDMSSSALAEDTTSDLLLLSGGEGAARGVEVTTPHPHQEPCSITACDSDRRDTTTVHAPRLDTPPPSTNVRSHAVRAALNARRMEQQQHTISTPVKQQPTSGRSVHIDGGTSDERRAVRLVAITERLQQLRAQHRIFRFAHGFVIHGKGRTNRQRTASGFSSMGCHDDDPSIDELSVLQPFEAHQRERNAEAWGRDCAAVDVTLAQVLARRDAVRHAKETDAASVVVRFMRRCVAHRKNRQRLVSERRHRQHKVAVRAIEHWWVLALPLLRSRRHAHRHTQSLTRERLQQRMVAFENCTAAVLRLQRMGRGYEVRLAFGRAYPQRKFEMQSGAIASALWFRDAQKEVRAKRVLSASRRASGEANELRIRAAVRIQALVRRMCARARTRAMKSRLLLERRAYGGATMAERQYAVRCLQRTWRRHAAKRCARQRRAAATTAAEARGATERRRWAASKLVGFARIATAKRTANDLRLAAALREKEVRRLARNPSRKRAEMAAALKHAMQRADAVAGAQAASQLLQTPGMAHASDLVQRELQRTMKLHPSTVPKLDLEANFLSNVSDSSRTLEREDDSFEVRLMHRLLQAPTALLYLLSMFVCIDANGAQGPPPVAGAHEVPPQRTENSVVVADDEDCSGGETDSTEADGDGPRDAERGRRLFDDGEDSSTRPPTSDGSSAMFSGRVLSVQPSGTAALHRWNMVRRSMCTARLTYRGHGELLLEDQDGVPSVPKAPEPFAKWSIAHQLVFRIFDEAAVYAWKMIFSHTAHDAHKQNQLATEEERTARMARVHQRNQLILACYDCETESQWLSSAKKNIGFVGKIWSPIRYLDADGDDDDNVEDRALDSYRFVDDFLLQCFPSAYSLRDVPGLLVACGLYLAMKRSIEAPFASSMHAADAADADPFAPIEAIHDPKHVAQIVQQEISAAGPPPRGRRPRDVCAQTCLDALVQLQRMSEECLSPTVTVAPSRRSVQDENYVDGDSDDDNNSNDDDDEDEDEDEDDDGEGYRRIVCVSHAREGDALATMKNSHKSDEGHSTSRSDLPERTGGRLGYIGERENEEESATPSTGSNLFAPMPDRHASSVDEDELGEGVPPASSDELSDSERDEELAKQILLDQHNMAPLSPDTGYSATLLGLHVATDDHRDAGIRDGLDGTGHGQHTHPPGDSCSDSDGDHGFQDDGIVLLTVDFDVASFDGVRRPRVAIEPSTMLGNLAERLAAALLDVRADTQMFDEI